MSEDVPREAIAQFQKDLASVRAELARVVVGQGEIVDGVLTCLLAGGHCLLEGVPGLGKTLLVRTLGRVLDLNFSRIQFTPDLIPVDILGAQVLVEDGRGGKAIEFQRGPIFANIVLADEINRATPKTQSALLEAMQEQSVTVARVTHEIAPPFFVLATQNPLEMEGTYPLPEAQLDRFFFKLQVAFPDLDAMHAILERTTGNDVAEVKPVLPRARILALRELVRRVPVARTVQDLAVRAVMATHPDRAEATPKVKRFVRFGASPRGAQAVLLGAKIRAVMQGRFAASADDVRACALPALRHRVILNFEGEAEGVRADDVLGEVLASLKPAG
ncbi:MAG: MoxR family ATPase [Polyangiales bacterium]